MISYRYIYTPVKYYMDYKGLPHFVASNLSITDPLEAFNGVEIILNKDNLELIGRSDAGKVTRVISSTTSNNIECDDSVCTEIIPELESLYNSRETPPDPWYTYVDVEPPVYKDEAIHKIWRHFAIAYSTRYYFAKDTYEFLDVVQQAKIIFDQSTPINRTGIKLMSNYISELAQLESFLPPEVIVNWNEETKEIYMDLPVVAVNVTYRSNMSIQFSVVASVVNYNEYYSGLTIGLLPLYTNHHEIVYNGIQ